MALTIAVTAGTTTVALITANTAITAAGGCGDGHHPKDGRERSSAASATEIGSLGFRADLARVLPGPWPRAGCAPALGITRASNFITPTTTVLKLYIRQESHVSPLVSSYGASRALERDRQTIERAVRGLAPDGYEKGKPRWRLARIVEALNPPSGGTVNSDLEQKFQEIDARYAAVRDASTLAERRELARAFFTFVAEVEIAMHADSRRSGEDRCSAALRIAEHTRLNVLTLRDALAWDSDKTWAEFIQVNSKDSEHV